MHQAAVTDSLGHYEINNLKSGPYTLKATFVAYRDTSLKIILRRDTVIDLRLGTTQMLSEVTIRAQKPIFQQELDRRL